MTYIATTLIAPRTNGAEEVDESVFQFLRSSLVRSSLPMEKNKTE